MYVVKLGNVLNMVNVLVKQNIMLSRIHLYIHEALEVLPGGFVEINIVDFCHS